MNIYSLPISRISDTGNELTSYDNKVNLVGGSGETAL